MKMEGRASEKFTGIIERERERDAFNIFLRV